MAFYGDGKHNENMEYVEPMENSRLTTIPKQILREVLDCLNQIPNTKVKNKKFKNTYEICTEINRYI